MSRIPVDSSSRSCWSSKGSPSISAKHFGRLPIAPFNRLPQPAARIIACPTPSALLRAARNRWSFRTIGWKDIGRPKMTLWNGSTQPDQIISGSVTDLLQRGRRAAGVRRPARGVRCPASYRFVLIDVPQIGAERWSRVARLAGGDLDRILLVGGPTQSPVLRAALSERL